jgi:hypothetical protein
VAGHAPAGSTSRHRPAPGGRAVLGRVAKVDQGRGRSRFVGRGDLTNGQWARLEPLLPTGKKPGRPQTWTRRQLIEPDDHGLGLLARRADHEAAYGGCTGAEAVVAAGHGGPAARQPAVPAGPGGCPGAPPRPWAGRAPGRTRSTLTRHTVTREPRPPAPA